MYRLQVLRVFTALLCGMALLLGSAPALARAEPTIVNPKLSYTLNVSASPRFQLSPDGSRVVYVAHLGVAQLLYSAPTDGSSLPVLLSPITDFNNVVLSFKITPSGSHVVYHYGLPDQDDIHVEQRKLYSVPIAGGAAIQLNPMLPPFGSVEDFRISPDGNWVVYRADLDTNGMYELHSVPVVGGASLKINPDPQGWGIVRSDYQITPDSSQVIYRAQLDGDDTLKLYTSPIAGFGATQLNAPLVNGGNVMDFAIGPDSAYVVYRADQVVDEQLDLYAVALGQSPPTAVKLNGRMIPNGDVDTFKISPDGSRVFYLADTTVFHQHELYSVTISGGKQVKLNGPLVPGGFVRDTFVISPDSAWVFYHATQDTVNAVELYAVPTTGGNAVKLNGSLIANGSVLAFALSPDGSRLIYLADQQVDEQARLYNVQVPGAQGLFAVTPIGAGLPEPGAVTGFQISPDSSRVVFLYRHDGQDDALSGLYSVLIDGGAVTKVSGQLVDGGTLSHQFAVSPDGNRVVYRAKQETVTTWSLFASYPAAPDDLTTLVPTP